MKFLLVLSVLAASSVFAEPNKRPIFCYEQAEQGGHTPLAYFLEERGEGMQNLHIVWPYQYPSPLTLKENGCLEHPGGGVANGGGSGGLLPQPERLTLCPGQGQHINGLVPVEASNEVEHTVYCDRRINRWFENR